ncbi:hypothetical protein MKW92_049744 [Papaver armeniacum]|nr:hypothetical protein MKW92_049744 [Papaver armeniacum]
MLVAENLSLSLLQSKSSKHKFSVNAEISTDSGGNGGSGSGIQILVDVIIMEMAILKNHSSKSNFGILGLLLNGWRSRVAVDPQFPIQGLMEEIVGVSACVLGDMASRPNFGLNELRFYFLHSSPTMGSASSTLPAIFDSCPTSHMFEPGMFSLLDRSRDFCVQSRFCGSWVCSWTCWNCNFKWIDSNEKKMDPSFETPNKPPPTILNAMTWAGHMGFSSNLRYQTLNESNIFIVLRCLNNILEGVSFVALARLTGSQRTGESQVDIINEGEEDEETALLVERLS